MALRKSNVDPNHSPNCQTSSLRLWWILQKQAPSMTSAPWTHLLHVWNMNPNICPMFMTQFCRFLYTIHGSYGMNSSRFLRPNDVSSAFSIFTVMEVWIAISSNSSVTSSMRPALSDPVCSSLCQRSVALGCKTNGLWIQGDSNSSISDVANA